jgi:hypothetical protein
MSAPSSGSSPKSVRGLTRDDRPYRGQIVFVAESLRRVGQAERSPTNCAENTWWGFVPLDPRCFPQQKLNNPIAPRLFGGIESLVGLFDQFSRFH